MRRSKKTIEEDEKILQINTALANNNWKMMLEVCEAYLQENDIKYELHEQHEEYHFMWIWNEHGIRYQYFYINGRWGKWKKHCNPPTNLYHSVSIKDFCENRLCSEWYSEYGRYLTPNQLKDYKDHDLQKESEESIEINRKLRMKKEDAYWLELKTPKPKELTYSETITNVSILTLLDAESNPYKNWPNIDRAINIAQCYYYKLISKEEAIAHCDLNIKMIDDKWQSRSFPIVRFYIEEDNIEAYIKQKRALLKEDNV